MALPIKQLICLFICNILFFTCEVNGQDVTSQTSNDTIVEDQFFIYPFVFYLPETRWGFGGVGLYTFRFKGERYDSNPSQIQFTANYTQNKQINFIIPFELYWFNDKWKLKGVLYDFKKGGILESNPIIGKEGGRVAGIGFITQYDNRDFIYNPTKGCYIEAEFFVGNKLSGSQYASQRFALDAATYIPLAVDHTLAVQLNTATIYGDAFFNDLLYFGSPKLMRGYQDRRFTDKNLVILQAEYRYPIYIYRSTQNPSNTDYLYLTVFFQNILNFNYGEFSDTAYLIYWQTIIETRNNYFNLPFSFSAFFSFKRYF